MKIKLTDFALRHFDKDFSGTKILNTTPENFEDAINDEETLLVLGSLNGYFDDGSPKNLFQFFNGGKIMNGYAPFCKLLVINNFTDAKVGSLPITLENYQYLRSGYSARRPEELPMFGRWFELPIEAPEAEWLVLVLYSKEQIDKEGRITEGEHGNPNETYKPFEADWGIVAILGQSHPDEEPMKPETMLRNALGIEEGGSGVKLDREKYLESVKFWSQNATVR